MTNALAWIASRARRENELHRQRFADVWEWQRNQPPGDERLQFARWYGEWTGNFRPRRGGLDDAPLTPGLHSGHVSDAYERYLEYLSAVYEPGRMGPPVPPLQAASPPAKPELPGSDGAAETVL